MSVGTVLSSELNRRLQSNNWDPKPTARTRLSIQSAESAVRPLQYKMPVKTSNYYTEVEAPYYKKQGVMAVIMEELAEQILEDMRSDSATGPDELPAQVLKECAKVLAAPFCGLARLTVRQGRWPELWLEHWITPLYKRNNVFRAGNNRRVHLTAQLSKAIHQITESLVYASTFENCRTRTQSI